MISIAPVRKQVTVNATQERAFALFTNLIPSSSPKSKFDSSPRVPPALGWNWSIAICNAWASGRRRYAAW